MAGFEALHELAPLIGGRGKFTDLLARGRELSLQFDDAGLKSIGAGLIMGAPRDGKGEQNDRQTNRTNETHDDSFPCRDEVHRHHQVDAIIFDYFEITRDGKAISPRSERLSRERVNKYFFTRSD
jgi:hypothetical protein